MKISFIDGQNPYRTVHFPMNISFINGQNPRPIPFNLAIITTPTTSGDETDVQLVIEGPAIMTQLISSKDKLVFCFKRKLDESPPPITLPPLVIRDGDWVGADKNSLYRNYLGWKYCSYTIGKSQIGQIGQYWVRSSGEEKYNKHTGAIPHLLRGPNPNTNIKPEGEKIIEDGWEYTAYTFKNEGRYWIRDFPWKDHEELPKKSY